MGAIVLCGEPGIGKSTELKVLRETLEAELDSVGESAQWISFRDIRDGADFQRRTVDSTKWQTWREGLKRMTLVVDGVDEGLLRVPNFVSDLASLLEDQPLERLRLILACRTAEWPVKIAERLLAKWPKEATGSCYELCPLRRKDAELAASERGVDAEKFLEAVWKRSVEGLAARPISLFFLLREFRNGELPATHRDLYERGTENLVREIDPERLELLRALQKIAPGCSDHDRLYAARRLATLFLLTGRSAIRKTGAAFERSDS